MAYEQVDDSFKEQFRKIYDYIYEIIRSNPWYIVKVTVQENDGTWIFMRFYICLKVCKDRFMCWPIIWFDGCFFKSKYGGELLTTIGRDGNDHMMPIA